MGLCKCPRKKVTNLFCFEHRVNVCEHCLVEKHETCVVQSYLAWLQDSDYDSSCNLCRQPFSDFETVRLQCLHLVHWPCLDTWAKRYPAQTAPAGFRCPVCNEMLFPKPNQVSPVIDKFKQKLHTANWARAGLGLSLLPELDQVQVHVSERNSAYPDTLAEEFQRSPNEDQSNRIDQSEHVSQTAVSLDDDHALAARKQVVLSNQQSEWPTPATEPLLSDAATNNIGGLSRDEDLAENKYKRRSATEWLRRWLRSRSLYPRKGGLLGGYKRPLLFCLLLIIGLITLISILGRVLNGPPEDDPFLDPMNPNNLNIRLPRADDYHKFDSDEEMDERQVDAFGH